MEDLEKLIDVESNPRSKMQLSKAIESSDVNLVCQALICAAQQEPDWRWSQTKCLSMLKHESLIVRACALIAIGKIAMFWGKIDEEVVLPELQQSTLDPMLAPFVKEALDELARLKR